MFVVYFTLWDCPGSLAGDNAITTIEEGAFQLVATTLTTL